MHPNIQTLLYGAESRYLNRGEIEAYKSYTSSLAQRLETYELLRDCEINIFQPIADKLLRTYPEQQQMLEKSLKNWLSALRYCAMAMLLDNQEFLQRRVLEWLTDTVQAHQTRAIDTSLYQLLQAQMQQLLTKEQLALLQPFLSQAATTMLATENLAQLPG